MLATVTDVLTVTDTFHTPADRVAPMATADASLPETDTRARRRARLRAEAQEIATRRFTERGYDEVTMAEIAEALDVSERTLFRHFPSKESLLDPAHEELVVQLATELAARPESESAFVAVRESLRALGDELNQDRTSFAVRMEIIQANPTMQAHLLQRQTELEEAIAKAVATRAGIDPTTDLRPALFASAAVCALRIAVERWVATDTDADLMSYLEESLDVLANGLGDL
jgi:AcrR family transcriptional regulator